MTQSDNTKPTVWAIGGADSLGVAADIRAAVANHVQCATIVSSADTLTSEQLSATSIEMLKAQWQSICVESQANVFNIGLLVTAEQVAWLAQKLSIYRQRHSELTIIYEPVLVNSEHQSLAEVSMIAAIKEQLLPQVDLLIVNTSDAQRLTGQTLAGPEDVIALGQGISQQYRLSVLISQTDEQRALIYDYFLASDHHANVPLPSGFVMTTPYQGQEILPSKKCRLSSLVASLTANNYVMSDALILAKAIMNQAIFKPHPLGNNRDKVFQLNPVNSFNDLPDIFSFSQFSDWFIKKIPRPVVTAFAPCEANLGLYPVVDSTDWLEKLLRLGVKTIQLRCKDLSETEAEPQVKAAITLGRQYEARVFINDYWRLAIKHQAYGIHLGQEDLAVADLALIKSSGLRLGVSTHNVHEALIALKLKPSYIALGHIFETQTKDMPSKPQGLTKLALQVQLFNHRCPLVAIGGISAKCVTAVKATNIGSIALVSAITKADDYEAVTTALLAEVGCGDPITNSARAFAATDYMENHRHG